MTPPNPQHYSETSYLRLERGSPNLGPVSNPNSGSAARVLPPPGPGRPRHNRPPVCLKLPEGGHDHEVDPRLPSGRLVTRPAPLGLQHPPQDVHNGALLVLRQPHTWEPDQTASRAGPGRLVACANLRPASATTFQA